MKVKYLFPNKFKRIGWFILVPALIIGLATVVYEYEPSFLNVSVPAIFIDGLTISDSEGMFGMVNNNILNEILGILVIISALLVAFSKEKIEDEYISKIRLESLVWAVYINYGILILSFLFIFNITFLWVMLFNMFTILLFFIIRFNWQISKLK